MKILTENTVQPYNVEQVDGKNVLISCFVDNESQLAGFPSNPNSKTVTKGKIISIFGTSYLRVGNEGTRMIKDRFGNEVLDKNFYGVSGIKKIVLKIKSPALDKYPLTFTGVRCDGFFTPVKIEDVKYNYSAKEHEITLTPYIRVAWDNRVPLDIF